MVNQKRKTERKNENSKLLKFIVHLVVSLLRVGIVADTKKKNADGKMVDVKVWLLTLSCF